MNKLTSASCIVRHPANPVLQASDIPYNAALIFNAGVTKYQGKYVMIFRNDYGSLAEQKLTGTNMGLAFSDDGVKWDVQPEPCFAISDGEISRVYDPRLTVINGICYLCFAVDTRHGIRGGIAKTDDFQKFDILSMSTPDNRNMVLFPELINGRFARFERPFPVYSRWGRPEAFDIWYSDSPDCEYWGNVNLVLGGEQVPFSNSKIGPGAPPIKTKKGWLAAIHAVDIDPERGKNGWEDKWTKRYTAGLILLDLNEPWKVIGMCPTPLIAPEATYETDGGFRNDVIFPGGMVLEDDGEVKIYYGSADTVECLATAHVDELLALIEPFA